jgi:hypothetical protein
VEYASRSSVLLHVEVSRDRVSQSGLKTGEGVTAGGAHSIIIEVVSRSSLRRTGQCDELRWTLLRLLCHFYYISPYGHYSLFSILLRPINRTLDRWSFLSLIISYFVFLRL